MNNTAQYNARAAKHKRRLNHSLMVIALVVVFSIAYMLMMPALTAGGSFICGLEEHTHTEECYETVSETVPVFQCSAPHWHDSSCYNELGELICGYADFYLHIHEDSCYDADGALICPLAEIPEHTHSSACYDANGALICGLREAQWHVHSESCYDEEGKLICGELQTVSHHHESCIVFEEKAVQKLICELPEHVHSDECLDIEPEPTASEEGYTHVHTDECYRDGVLICTLTETVEEQEPAIVTERDGSETLPYVAGDYADGITVEYPEDVKELLESGKLFENSDELTFTLKITNAYSFVGNSWFEYTIPYALTTGDGEPILLNTDKEALLSDGQVIGEWYIKDNKILCFFGDTADVVCPVTIELPICITAPAENPQPQMNLLKRPPIAEMMSTGHDGSEEAPYTVEDYGGAVVVSYLDEAEERLLSDDPFHGNPSFSFKLQIDNSDTYMANTWFVYEVPVDYEKYPNATLRCEAEDHSILGKGINIGEWEIRGNSIYCHFNDLAESCNLVHMLFTLTLASGEDEGHEFDLEHPFVCVCKIDAYTREPLEGVVFALFDEDGVELARDTTDKDGYAYFYMTYSGTNLNFYEAYYIKEMYDVELPAFMSEYAKDNSERWFVSTGDTIPPLREATYRAILERHPGIIRITQSDREKYVNGTGAFEVLNYPYYSLPETGGIGTLGIILLGMTVLALAVVTVRRRKTAHS